MILSNLNEALKYFIGRRTEEGDRVEFLGYNKGNRGPVSANISINNKKYLLFFKRDWLHSFSYLFNKKGQGWGQTFNMLTLGRAADDQYMIVVVMPNLSTYYVDALEAYRYVVEQNTIRVPSTETGEEGSIPARMLSSDDPYSNV